MNLVALLKFKGNTPEKTCADDLASYSIGDEANIWVFDLCEENFVMWISLEQSELGELIEETYLPPWITIEKYVAFRKAMLDHRRYVAAARTLGTELPQRLLKKLIGKKLTRFFGHGFKILEFEDAILETTMAARFIREGKHILGSDDYRDDEYDTYDECGDFDFIAKQEPLVLGGVIIEVGLTELAEPIIIFDNGIVLETFSNSFYNRWPFYLEVDGEKVSFGEG
jgi:hypothetical protein